MDVDLPFQKNIKVFVLGSSVPLTMANNRNKFLTNMSLYSNYELFLQEYQSITYLKDFCGSLVILSSSDSFKSCIITYHKVKI